MVSGPTPLTRTNIIYKYTNIKSLKNPNYYLHTLKSIRYCIIIIYNNTLIINNPIILGLTPS